MLVYPFQLADYVPIFTTSFDHFFQCRINITIYNPFFRETNLKLSVQFQFYMCVVPEESQSCFKCAMCCRTVMDSIAGNDFIFVMTFAMCCKIEEQRSIPYRDPTAGGSFSPSQIINDCFFFEERRAGQRGTVQQKSFRCQIPAFLEKLIRVICAAVLNVDLRAAGTHYVIRILLHEVELFLKFERIGPIIVAFAIGNILSLSHLI